MKHECHICGYHYETEEAAAACEAQGVRGNELQLGDTFELPFNGGVIFEVIELLQAAEISHVPGVLALVIEGDLSPLYMDGKAPDKQIFDEETAKKYLKQRK